MAPVSCGDRVLVVSSPYKSNTHSWASIQLGQHKLKPFATTLGPSVRVTKWDVGQNSTPAPLSNVVLQPCSFDSHCAGWVARSLKKSIIHSYTPVMRLRGIRFGEQHARTLWTISSHRPLLQHQQQLDNTFRSIGRCTIRHMTTRVSERQQESTLKDQGAKMLVVSGHEVRCREDLNMSNKMCVLFVMVFR